jgi:hypothetical protein
MHTWLAEERYLEDLPEPYENPKEAAIARARENGPRKASKTSPAKEVGLSPKTPIGRHKVKIVGSELPDDGGNPEFRMRFCYRIEDGDREGTEFSHTFKLVSNDESLQTDGQSIYADQQARVLINRFGRSRWQCPLRYALRTQAGHRAARKCLINFPR